MPIITTPQYCPSAFEAILTFCVAVKTGAAASVAAGCLHPTGS
jgi:acetyl-CoA acetyltransferase